MSLKAFTTHFGKIIVWGIWIFVLGGTVIGLLAGLAIGFQNAGYPLLAAIPGTLGVIFILIWTPMLHLGAYYIYKSLFLVYNE